MELISRKRNTKEQERLDGDWNNVHTQLQSVQKKSLEISDPGDDDEKEADSVASKVMNGESSQIHGSGSGVNRKGEGSMEATSEFQSQLSSKKGSGSPLDDSVRSEMELKMGADFSGVNIHTGSEASSMSESINAKAFTHGQDVFFKRGEYNPSSSQGKELLAHELVHTVQQNHGRIQTKIQRQPNVKDDSKQNQSETDDPRIPVVVLLNDEIRKWYDTMVNMEAEPTAERLAFRKSYYATVIIYQQAHGVDRDTAQWIVDDVFAKRTDKNETQEHYWTHFWGDGAFQGFTDADFKTGSHSFNLSKIRYDQYELILRGNVDADTDVIVNDVAGISDIDGYIEELKTSDPERYKELVRKTDAEFRARTGFKGAIDPDKQPELKKQWDDIFKDFVKQDIVTGKIDKYPPHVQAYLTPERLNSPMFWQHIRMAEMMQNVSPEQYAQFQNEATNYVWPGEPMGGVVTSFENYIKNYQARIASIDTATTDEELQNIGRSLTLADIMELSFAQRIKLIKALINRAEFKDQDTIIKITTYFQTTEYNDYINELIANDYELFQLMDDELDAPFYTSFHEQLKFYGIYAGGIDNFKAGVSKITSEFDAENGIKNYTTGTSIIPFGAPGLFSTDEDYSYDVTYEDGQIHIKVYQAFGAVRIPVKDQMFKPLDIVGVYVITGKEGVAEDGQLLLVPALNLEFFHEKDKSQTWENLLDAAFIVIGVIGMVLAPNTVVFWIAAIDTAFFVADSIIRSYRDELLESEAGREFLEAWDVVNGVMTVFGIAQAVLALPEIFMALRNGWNALKTNGVFATRNGTQVNVISEMTGDVETVLNGSDEIANAKKADPDFVPEPQAKDPDAVKDVKTAELGGPVTKVNNALDETYIAQKSVFSQNRNIIANADSNSKGAWAEIGANSRMSEAGYETLTIRKTTLTQGWGEQGIDQIFRKNGEYFIQEVKYKGTATLKKTDDGLQLSETWIRGSDRLMNAVQDEALVNDILAKGYRSILAEVAPDGSIIFTEVDNFAKPIGNFTP